MRRFGLWLLGFSLVVPTAAAEETWLLQFQAYGGVVYPPCGGIIWYDDVTFHNGTDTALTIEPVETSNGGSRNSLPLVVPAHSTRSGYEYRATEIQSWAPDPGTQRWVVRLNVPVGISVASRALAVIRIPNPEFCGPDPGPTTVFAGPALPVVRQLASSGTRQILLNTDIGESEKFGGSRINIGIYNGGSVAATATVELRRSCDDSVFDHRVISVPAKTIVQTLGPSNVSHSFESCANSSAFPSRSYASVTVDQPSFGYIATLANQIPPTTPFTFSFPR